MYVPAIISGGPCLRGPGVVSALGSPVFPHSVPGWPAVEGFGMGLNMHQPGCGDPLIAALHDVLLAAPRCKMRAAVQDRGELGDLFTGEVDLCGVGQADTTCSLVYERYVHPPGPGLPSDGYAIVECGAQEDI